MKVSCSWSGGKDSTFALMQAMKGGAQPQVLMTMMHEEGAVSRSHGISKSLLQAQAEALGLPWVGIPATWGTYEVNFIDRLQTLKEQYQLEAVVFGDIDIESHRVWEEKVCEAVGIQALLPLWQGQRRDLVTQMLAHQVEAIITSCQASLADEFLGKALDRRIMEAMESRGIDACGENGEYHTLVVNCPIFEFPIALPTYKRQDLGHYSFLAWQ